MDLGSSMREGSLGGQFFGAAPQISQYIRAVNNIWGRSKIDVIPFGIDNFLFKFENEQTKAWVL